MCMRSLSTFSFPLPQSKQLQAYKQPEEKVQLQFVGYHMLYTTCNGLFFALCKTSHLDIKNIHTT